MGTGTSSASSGQANSVAAGREGASAKTVTTILVNSGSSVRETGTGATLCSTGVSPELKVHSHDAMTGADSSQSTLVDTTGADSQQHDIRAVQSSIAAAPLPRSVPKKRTISRYLSVGLTVG